MPTYQKPSPKPQILEEKKELTNPPVVIAANEPPKEPANPVKPKSPAPSFDGGMKYYNKNDNEVTKVTARATFEDSLNTPVDFKKMSAVRRD